MEIKRDEERSRRDEERSIRDEERSREMNNGNQER